MEIIEKVEVRNDKQYAEKLKEKLEDKYKYDMALVISFGSTNILQERR